MDQRSAPGALLPGDPERFERQMRLTVLGEDGQRRLRGARVGVVGCGALGSVLAERLLRAGVGFLRVIDRDVVEWSNLPRQMMFTEQDAANATPKAEAAARTLAAIDSGATVETEVVELTEETAPRFLEGLDVVVDGLDSFGSRLVLNRACVERDIPWVYGGVLATTGMMMVIRPGVGPCLRCLLGESDAPDAGPSCADWGVLGTTPALVACLQATEAIKLLVAPDAAHTKLLHLDLWSGTWNTVAIDRDPSCPVCGDSTAGANSDEKVGETTDGDDDGTERREER